MKLATLVLLVAALSSCAAWSKKIDEIDPCICDGCGLDCTCEDAARHLGCLEPTGPHDVTIFGPGAPNPSKAWRRSDLKHLTRKAPTASPAP